MPGASPNSRRRRRLTRLVVIAQTALLIVSAFGMPATTAASGITAPNLDATSNAAPGEALRGWWKLDGNANDSSALANNASLVGAPPFVAGRVGQSLSLNGTSQYATVPDANSLDLTTGMTLSAW